MRLYLDDDSQWSAVVRFLQERGHDVLTANDAGLSGADDPIHLTRAILERRAFLSGNHDDFEILHFLVRAAQGHHPGILIVRRDNNPRRDLSPRGIANAVSKLESWERKWTMNFTS